MNIGVEGVMPMYANTVAQIVESIDSVSFKRVPNPRLPRTTIAFTCDADDAEATKALVKKTLRANDWGKSHVFNVTILS